MRLCRQLAASPDASGSKLLLDGVHLITEAIASGIALDVVVASTARLGSMSEAGELARRLDAAGVDVVAAPDVVFSALSPVRTPSGVVAVGSRTPVTVDDVLRCNGGLVLVALDVQDPGNLGSMLRAAEAAGASGVLVGGVSASPFSWKALRGSMGSALRLPVAAGIAPQACVALLQNAGFRAIASVPAAGRDPDEVDWRGRVGLIMGGEGPGLPAELAARCNARVTIPMAAPVGSLNVAVAAGVLAYAARRQRLRKAPTAELP